MKWKQKVYSNQDKPLLLAETQFKIVHIPCNYALETPILLTHPCSICEIFMCKEIHQSCSFIFDNTKYFSCQHAPVVINIDFVCTLHYSYEQNSDKD